MRSSFSAPITLPEIWDKMSDAHAYYFSNGAQNLLQMTESIPFSPNIQITNVHGLTADINTSLILFKLCFKLKNYRNSGRLLTSRAPAIYPTCSPYYAIQFPLIWPNPFEIIGYYTAKISMNHDCRHRNHYLGVFSVQIADKNDDFHARNYFHEGFYFACYSCSTS